MNYHEHIAQHLEAALLLSRKQEGSSLLAYLIDLAILENNEQDRPIEPKRRPDRPEQTFSLKPVSELASPRR
ncbi:MULTISPECIES: hypothetical protein [unclassified Neorhizobium]|uniref:hypothetical protein n=1 Tax=unclassified Neorhizobium TaxID=2629175 RepID=UPI001FF2FF6C|nr:MULTISPECIES: hypothetical protein [unclassified Neorhizobium]MCJ9670332.1 hypothetical protein [Neorhizobium sp. SHOUNA12B]MCJ9746587.1 hypothetical protein [Neorhizobium sp. SHOUNA12A]